MAALLTQGGLFMWAVPSWGNCTDGMTPEQELRALITIRQLTSVDELREIASTLLGNYCNAQRLAGRLMVAQQTGGDLRG